jgi:tyrosine-protein kinase
MRRHWLLLLVTVIVAGSVGYHKAPRPSPDYLASAQLLVSTPGPQTAAQLGTIEEDVVTLIALMSTPSTAAIAVSDSGVERSPYEVAASTSASLVPGTGLIDYRVGDVDPSVATRLATVMPGALQAELDRIQSAGPRPGSLTMTLFEPPMVAPPRSGVSRKLDDTALACLFGLVLAVSAALLIDRLDVTVKAPADVGSLGLPVLGTVGARARAASADRPGDGRVLAMLTRWNPWDDTPARTGQRRRPPPPA